MCWSPIWVAERAALSYAVGEWARVWPLQSLIRAMGAYFIRRRSRDGLYRKVLARYVAIATEAGVTQAVFPEGGLSLDGRLQPPKLGILSYIVDGAQNAGRDVVFVPVALNYDRVLEDRVLIEARRKGERRFRAPGADDPGLHRPASLAAPARPLSALWRRRRRLRPAAVAVGVPARQSRAHGRGAGRRADGAHRALGSGAAGAAGRGGAARGDRAAVARAAITAWVERRAPDLAASGEAGPVAHAGVERLARRGLVSDLPEGVSAASEARETLAFSCRVSPPRRGCRCGKGRAGRG